MTENKSVLTAGDAHSLCLAVHLPFTKPILENGLYDVGEELGKYRDKLAVLFKCPDLKFECYTTYEYSNKFTIYARALAEELDVPDFSEAVSVLKRSISEHSKD